MSTSAASRRERDAFEAWAKVRRERELLAATLSETQRKALDELLESWRTAHLRDVLVAGGPKIERVARKLLEVE